MPPVTSRLVLAPLVPTPLLVPHLARAFLQVTSVHQKPKLLLAHQAGLVLKEVQAARNAPLVFHAVVLLLSAKLNVLMVTTVCQVKKIAQFVLLDFHVKLNRVLLLRAASANTR